MTGMPQVVVIGGGFAGLAATQAAAEEGFQVTLIDRHPYHTFQPLLYQVATGGLNPGDVTYSLRYFTARFPDVAFHRATVVGIDRELREVACDDGASIGYDYLIVANGITGNHFGIPGAAENSVSVYTRADALRARDRIFGGIETIAGAAADNEGRFTALVVGGGATGVELAGQLAELRTQAIPKVWPELNPSLVHIVLVEMGPELLAPFDARLRRYALRELVKRGVDVRLKTTITQVHPDRVDFGDGRSLATDLVIWAAGVGGYPMLRDWGLPIGRAGRVQVNSALQTITDQRVFAVGDACLVLDHPLPQLAQPAIQSGRHAAQQIARLHLGQPVAPFRYRDKGMMATIGRADAVVQLPSGLRFTGLLAWLAWIGLHLMFLLGNRNRLQTLVNLAIRYTGLARGGIILGDVPEAPQLEEGAPRLEEGAPRLGEGKRR